MKNFIFKSSLFLAILLSGCGMKNQSIQKDDVAFLKFETRNSYKIVVNDDLVFNVKNTENITNKNISYKIKSGKSNVKAYKDGRLVYDKDVYVGLENTKIIDLP